MTTNKAEYLESSFREKMLEHIFLSELLKVGWGKGKIVDVLRPEVDRAGYDLLLECEGVSRYVQLKGSSNITVHGRLAKKRGGCVIKFDYTDTGGQASLKYRFFGKGPTEYLVLGNELGKDPKTRKERPTTRKLPIGRFDISTDIEELFCKLFPEV